MYSSSMTFLLGHYNSKTLKIAGMFFKERERGRERETDRQTERDRETDRQTDRERSQIMKIF